MFQIKSKGYSKINKKFSLHFFCTVNRCEVNERQR